jgi:hypothetical protein
VFDLLQVFGQVPRTQTNLAIATFIQSLAPLNSAANPLIYCLFSGAAAKPRPQVNHLSKFKPISNINYSWSYYMRLVDFGRVFE